MYQQLVGDSMDSVTEYNLLNAAKDKLEQERDWAYLMSLDETQSVATGDTYLSMKTLPSDFSRPMDSGIYVGTDIVPYDIIPFQDRIRWQSISHRYYIDLANSQYGIFGTPTAGTIHFFYLKTTPTLASGISPSFPERFHPILAYKMAQMFYAVDQGQKFIAWDDRWTAYYNEMFEAMSAWDARIQQNAQSNKRIIDRIDTRAYPDIIDGMF